MKIVLSVVLLSAGAFGGFLAGYVYAWEDGYQNGVTADRTRRAAARKAKEQRATS